MNKSISVERLYSLGDFQNIKFTDIITEIPEVIMKSPETMKLLRYLQLVDMEWSYVNYQNLRALEPKKSLEELLEFVETERTTTFEELLKTIKE